MCLLCDVSTLTVSRTYAGWVAKISRVANYGQQYPLRAIQQWRRGVILGHGDDLYFIYLFWVSQRSIFWREGGKNKEESKIVNVS